MDLPPFRKPSKQRLAVAIADDLKQLIRSGRLEPGDRLPNESELCEHYGVSRITIREAVQILRVLGVLEPTRGRGTFVREPDGEAFLEDLAYFAFDSAASVVDLFEVRGLLEQHSCRRAALKAPLEDRAELSTLIAEMREVLDSPGPLDLSRMDKLDIEFHLRIARISGNLVLEQLLKRVMQILEAVRIRSLSVPGQPQQSWEQHSRIVESIERGEPELAAARMVEHMECVKHAVISSEVPSDPKGGAERAHVRPA